MKESGVLSISSLLSLLVLITIILISSGGVIDGNNDVDALLAFKNTLIEKDALGSWTAGSSSPCGWKGVNCTVNGVLKTLMLSSSGLLGPMSRALGGLTSLEVLELSDNKLNGTIPAEMGNMTSLVGLALGHNMFSGIPPPELNKLSNLKDLLLNDNPFYGCLPTSKWSDLMKHVEQLDVSNTPNLDTSGNCN